MNNNFIRLTIKGKNDDGSAVELDNVSIKLLQESLDAFTKLKFSEDEEDPTVSLKKGSVVCERSIPKDFKPSSSHIKITPNNHIETNDYFYDFFTAVRKISKNNKATCKVTTHQFDKKFIDVDINETTVIDNPQKNEVEVDVELYLYGKIINIGGMKPNLHLKLSDQDIKPVVIDTDEETLRDQFLIYEDKGCRVTAKQNLKTKEYSNYKLIEFVNYIADYDEEKFQQDVKALEPTWDKELPDAITWQKWIRGKISDAEYEKAKLKKKSHEAK